MDRNEARMAGTATVWLFLTCGMIAMSFRLEADMIMTSMALMLAAGVLVSGFIWQGAGKSSSAADPRMAATDAEIEKAKRERIEMVLRDLSDEQLEVLRQRLATRAITDEDLRYMLDDDGELRVRRD